jgi:hypothetical protein
VDSGLGEALHDPPGASIYGVMFGLIGEMAPVFSELKAETSDAWMQSIFRSVFGVLGALTVESREGHLDLGCVRHLVDPYRYVDTTTAAKHHSGVRAEIAGW